ncbi:MAG: hypothetical protein L0338_11085 [Acidobacteria bacterium]|nr:hypothetical protein [Acidobacteriota bacterium]
MLCFCLCQVAKAAALSLFLSSQLGLPLAGGGTAVWDYVGGSVGVPGESSGLTPDTSLAKTSLPHSNDRQGGYRNSTEPGNAVANRKGNRGGGGGSSSGGASPGASAGGSAHLYAFVSNNPYGAVDPLGLDLWSLETGRDASGSHWLWGDQHWLYGNTDWSGLDYVDYSAPYRSSSGYSSSYYSYFDSGSAWDFSNPYDTIDYLSFDYRFTDTRDAISSARQSLWDAVPVLGGIKSFSEMVFGTQWFTGNRIDPIERGIATGIASVGFGALALEGFASRAAFSPAYVPFAAKGTGAFNPAFSGGGNGLGSIFGKEIRVSQRGLDLVEGHLARFGPVEENTMMLDRLRSALANGQKIRGGDASFYLHEASEATMMGRGMSYDAAHAAALQKYGVSPFSVYSPQVIQALPGSFNQNWFNFWGISRQ